MSRMYKNLPPSQIAMGNDFLWLLGDFFLFHMQHITLNRNVTTIMISTACFCHNSLSQTSFHASVFKVSYST